MKTALGGGFGFAVPAIIGLLVLLPAPAGLAARKALVVGIGDYEHSRKLENPGNDAEAMASRLELSGFVVTKLLDPGLAEFQKSLRQFSLSLSPKDAALFFFAGHGMQVRNVSYLIPKDAELDDPDYVDQSAISLEKVLMELDRDGAGARKKFVILDCCRDNPFGRNWRGGRSGSAGLAAMTLTSDGTVLCFATDPGRTAADGEADHSPYTKALLQHLFVPGQEFQAGLMDVGNEVKLITSENQRPWRNSNLNDPFYMIPGSPKLKPTSEEELEGADAVLATRLKEALRSGRKSDLPAALQEAIESVGDRKHEAIPDLIRAQIDLVCLRMILLGRWESEIDLKIVRGICEPPFDTDMAPLVLANEQFELADLLIADGQIEEANRKLADGFRNLDLGISRKSSLCALKKGSLLTRHAYFRYGKIEGLKLPGEPREGFKLLQDAYAAFRSKHLEKAYFGPARIVLPFDDEGCEVQAALAIAQCWQFGIGTGAPAAFDPGSGFAGKQSGRKATEYFRKVIELDPMLGEAFAGLLELDMQTTEGNYWNDEMIDTARRGAELDDGFCLYHYATYLWSQEKSRSLDAVVGLMRRAAAPGGEKMSITLAARDWLEKHGKN